MKKRLLTWCVALVMLMSIVALPTENAQAAATTATVKGGWLRLRAEASFDAQTLASYYTGTVVTVLGSSGKWYQVTAPDGRTGYMYSQYLTINTSSSGGSTSGYDNIAATVVSANGLGVRLRTGPSTAYGVLGVYPVGTSATILRSGSYWHYVRIGNRTGYMMSQFLSTGGSGSVRPPETSGGYTAYVTSQNGLGVRLRKGPGTGYGVLGLYSVGTRVNVLKHNNTWDYIRIGTRTGYMMNKFLTSDYVSTSKELKSVALSDYAPVPGTVLSAIISPSGADVTYQWLDGSGKLLSSAAVYTVQSGDVGKRIYVRVTGRGEYVGTLTSSSVQVSSAGSAVTKTPLTGVKLSNTAPTVGQTITAAATPAGATANYVWYRDDGANLGSGQSYTVRADDAGHAIYCAAYATGNYTGNIASYYTSKIPQPTADEKKFTGTVSLPASAAIGTTLRPDVSVNSSEYTLQWYADGAYLGTGSTLAVNEAMSGKNITCVAVAKEGSGYAGSVTSNGCTIERKSEPTHTAPVITTNYFGNATAGEYYTRKLTADAETSVRWTLQSGSLPQGISLSADGTVSGTPTAAGTSSFIVRAMDDNGLYAQKEFSITVEAAPVVEPEPVPEPEPEPDATSTDL